MSDFFDNATIIRRVNTVYTQRAGFVERVSWEVLVDGKRWLEYDRKKDAQAEAKRLAGVLRPRDGEDAIDKRIRQIRLDHGDTAAEAFASRVSWARAQSAIAAGETR